MGRTIFVDDHVVARALPRISRAAALRHSNRSFLEHLLCTWRILADWNMPVSVCRAGFLHSAYSTSYYSDALFRFDERDAVRRMIGREAEELVFRFCTMDRRTCWGELARSATCGPLTYADRTRPGTRVPVARNQLKQLLIIESANVAEQSRGTSGGPVPWMSRVLGWWHFLDVDSIPLRLGVRPELTRKADERAIEAYEHALTLPPRRALSLLDQAIEQNPWVAEPRITRALCERKDRRASHIELTKAAGLLSAWALAWDKRLSVNGWKVLCGRVHGASGSRSGELGFESLCAILSGRVSKPDCLAL